MVLVIPRERLRLRFRFPIRVPENGNANANVHGGFGELYKLCSNFLCPDDRGHLPAQRAGL